MELFNWQDKPKKQIKTTNVDKRVATQYKRRVTNMTKDFFDVRIKEIYLEKNS